MKGFLLSVLLLLSCNFALATQWVFTCDDSLGSSVAVTTTMSGGVAQGKPVCIGTDSSNDGSWQPMNSLAVPFDPSTLDPTTIIEAFGAGFFFCMPVWVVCIGAAIILKLIRKG